MTENDFFILIRKEMAEIQQMNAEDITLKTPFPDSRDFRMELSFRLKEYKAPPHLIKMMGTTGKLAAALALNASTASA